MVRRILSPLVLIAVIQTPFARCAAPAALPKAAEVKSWQADLVMRMDVEGQQVDVTGVVWAKRPDKMRMELTVSGVPDTKQIVYCDGKTVCVYLPKAKLATRLNPAQARARLGLPGQPEVADIANPFLGMAPDSVKKSREETLDGEPCAVYECQPAKMLEAKLPFMPATVRLWVSNKTGLLVRQDMFDDAGKRMMTQHFRNVKLDPDLPDSAFVFVAPKGEKVAVRDMTAGAVKALKGLK